VGFRLTPQDTGFYDLFATSASHLVVGSGILTQVLGAERGEREALAGKMRDAEHAADESTHAIFKKVNSSFITPFDREDIYALASALDDCMDMMEAAVDLIFLYQIDELPTGVAAQVEVLVRMSELTAEAMTKLRSMRDLDTGRMFAFTATLIVLALVLVSASRHVENYASRWREEIVL